MRLQVLTEFAVGADAATNTFFACSHHAKHQSSACQRVEPCANLRHHARGNSDGGPPSSGAIAARNAMSSPPTDHLGELVGVRGAAQKSKQRNVVDVRQVVRS